MSEISANNADYVFKVNTSTGTGSSFYLGNRQILVTNFHVIQGHRTVAIENQKKERYLAKVVFVNPTADVAFLQPSRRLHPRQNAFDSFARVQSREQVFVLGYPFGMPYTETKGIVSSARQLMEGRYYIQTDAAVNPGNSGGPMVNANGELVGITTAKFTNADNVGFAIPAEALEEDLESFSLNKDLVYSVKCHSCKTLIFKKTEFCNNCGSQIDSEVFEQVAPHQIAGFVEDALNFLGLNPVLARGGQDYWEFYYGTTFVTIYFQNREYLYAMSPINELPRENFEKLLKYILSAPLSNYKLGIIGNKIFISYRIHLSDIFTPYARTILKELAIFPLKADEMSGFFKEQFACGLTNYSKEEGVQDIREVNDQDEGLDLENQAETYASKAETFMKMGKFADALALYKKQETIYKETGDKTRLINSYEGQVNSFLELGKFQEALEVCRKQEVLCKEPGNESALAVCYHNMARIHNSMEQFESALRIFHRLESMYQTLKDPIGLADVYSGLGMVFYKHGDLRKAYSHFQKQEKVCQRNNDGYGLANAYRNQASMLTEMGQLEQAMSIYKREQKVLLQIDHRPGLADCYGNQAMILLEWGKLHDAMKFLKQEEQIVQGLGDRDRLAHCFSDQAIVLEQWNKLNDALLMYQKAEKIYEGAGNREGLARIWWYQGVTYHIKGDLNKQVTLWRKSIEMRRTLGLPTKESEEALQEALKKGGSRW